MLVKIGDKVMSKQPYATKIREVTKLHFTDGNESRWFAWGPFNGVHDANDYKLMPPDSVVDHSVSR